MRTITTYRRFRLFLKLIQELLKIIILILIIIIKVNLL